MIQSIESPDRYVNFRDQLGHISEKRSPEATNAELVDISRQVLLTRHICRGGDHL